MKALFHHRSLKPCPSNGLRMASRKDTIAPRRLENHGEWLGAEVLAR